MEIKLERILSRLEELYQCGAAADGTYTRKMCIRDSL